MHGQACSLKPVSGQRAGCGINLRCAQAALQRESCYLWRQQSVLQRTLYSSFLFSLSTTTLPPAASLPPANKTSNNVSP